MRVNLAERSYEILVGPSSLREAPSIIRRRLRDRCRKVFIVADEGLPPGLVERLDDALQSKGFAIELLRVVASEKSKSLDTLERLLIEITRAKIERTDVIVALGGGVVGDLAGFAAAVYRRGIPVLQCPTTLLAMVDASVGGKTGVNIDLARSGSGTGSDLKKNMAGAFHQPIGVLADIDALAGLNERFFRAGLAECVKHAMLGALFADKHLFSWTESSAPRILDRDAKVLTELIERNVALKARVVAGDEREERHGSGGRALLNLGHTFAHAIEALPGARGVLADGGELPGEIHHGEAVALGLRAAAEVSVRLRLVTQSYASRVREILDRFGLPQTARNLPGPDALLERMSHDKKNFGGNVRLVLPCAGGRARVVTNPSRNAVLAGIASILPRAADSAGDS